MICSVFPVTAREVCKNADVHHREQHHVQEQKWQSKWYHFLCIRYGCVHLIWWTYMITHWEFNGRMFLILQGSSWTLIDVPGHESLRVQIVEKYKAVARWVMKINMSFSDWGSVHEGLCTLNDDVSYMETVGSSGPALCCYSVYYKLFMIYKPPIQLGPRKSPIFYSYILHIKIRQFQFCNVLITHFLWVLKKVLSVFILFSSANI